MALVAGRIVRKPRPVSGSVSASVGVIRLSQLRAKLRQLLVRLEEDDDREILNPVARPLTTRRALRTIPPLFIDRPHLARQPHEMFSPPAHSREFRKRHTQDREPAEGENSYAEAEEDFNREWLVWHGGYSSNTRTSPVKPRVRSFFAAVSGTFVLPIVSAPICSARMPKQSAAPPLVPRSWPPMVILAILATIAAVPILPPEKASSLSPNLPFTGTMPAAMLLAVMLPLIFTAPTAASVVLPVRLPFVPAAMTAF